MPSADGSTPASRWSIVVLPARLKSTTCSTRAFAWRKAAATIAEGEVLQLVTQNDLSTTEGRYLEVIQGKTAALFAAACQIGAVVADRPERVAGNMKTSAFIPFWSKGKDSFAKVPPNADVSIIDGDTMRQVIVELQDPALDNDILRYKVKMLQGEMPEKGADVSVFIDIIGMPRTPYSFAGAGRRTWRRGWYR